MSNAIDGPLDVHTIDEAAITDAFQRWITAAHTHLDVPNTFFFMIDIECRSVGDYTGQRFDPFEGSFLERARINFLQGLGENLGFNASFGHLTLSLSGKGATETYPKWDYEFDDWDEESYSEHEADVWLERENIRRGQTVWRFTPVQDDGSLNQANGREFTAAEVLDQDWLPGWEELREPNESIYEGWEGRYVGEAGSLYNGMPCRSDLRA